MQLHVVPVLGSGRGLTAHGVQAGAKLLLAGGTSQREAQLGKRSGRAIGRGRQYARIGRQHAEAGEASAANGVAPVELRE